MRFVLYAIALILAGAFLCILVGVCTIVFLAERHCGAFGYYGCETPTTRGQQ